MNAGGVLEACNYAYCVGYLDFWRTRLNANDAMYWSSPSRDVLRKGHAAFRMDTRAVVSSSNVVN